MNLYVQSGARGETRELKRGMLSEDDGKPNELDVNGLTGEY